MKIFEADIFPFRFCVASSAEYERVKSLFVDADGEEIFFSDSMSGLVVRAKYRDSGSAVSLIVINKKTANLGTVAHEAFHSAEDLLENIKITHSFHTSEVYAYVIGFIAQKIYETIWE